MMRRDYSQTTENTAERVKSRSSQVRVSYLKAGTSYHIIIAYIEP